MMKLSATLALVLASAPLHAQNISDQDINLMGASVNAVNTYKSGGITKLHNAVNQCYAKLKNPTADLPKRVEFCVALDTSGIFIDYHMSQVNGFPRDERFMDNTASSRMHNMLLKTGISRNTADTRNYLSARHERIERYTLRAMSLEGDKNPPPKNKQACIQKEMEKWQKNREREIGKWCDDMAKKGEECRISAGQEAMAEEEALEKITRQCG